MMKENTLRKEAISLRKQGLSYLAIQDELKVKIPKSTLSGWLRAVPLPPEAILLRDQEMKASLERARTLAVIANKAKREKYLLSLWERNLYLSEEIEKEINAKIALAMLYLAEGAKSSGSTIVFGNSDPAVILLFLRLLKKCYEIDMCNMRCTVQCRADQNCNRLKTYWSSITGIPSSQFYKPNIDQRTFGKPTRRKDYKGVCRITYFSAEVYLDLRESIRIILMGL